MITLFQDEFSFSNHPSIASEWRLEKEQPLAKRAIGRETISRLCGALNPVTGHVCILQRAKVTVTAFISFLELVVQTYPNAKRIFLVIDNWPVHFHPDIIGCLEPQLYPSYFKTPPSWQHIVPKAKYAKYNWKIQLVPLPTYSSWLNPIEKFWKLLKQSVIHNHRFAKNFKELKALINRKIYDLLQEKLKICSFCGLANKKGIFFEDLSPQNQNTS